MAVISGDEANERMDGATSAITGETHSSDGYHKTGDTWFRDKGDGNEYMSKSNSSNGRDHDHIHYFPKDSDGNRGHRVSKEHTASDGHKYGAKKDYNSPGDTLFNGVKNFLGL